MSSLYKRQRYKCSLYDISVWST